MAYTNSTIKGALSLSGASDDVLNFSEWAHYLYTKKIAIATITLFFLALSYVYTKTIVPLYVADSLLQVEAKQARMPGIEEVTVMLDRGSRTLRDAGPREESIIKSRKVVGDAVDALDLRIETRFKYFPYFGEAKARKYSEDNLAPAPFGLVEYAWGGERLKVDRLDTPFLGNKRSIWTIVALTQGEYILKDQDGKEVLKGKVGEAASASYKGTKMGVYVSEMRAREGLKMQVLVSPRLFAINNLSAKIKVKERGERTGILEVSLIGKNRTGVKRTLNAVVDSYVTYNLKQHSKEAKKMLLFLNKHLPKIKENEDVAEGALQEFRVKEGTVDLSSQTQNAMETLSSIDKALSEIELKRTELLNTYTKKHPAIISMGAKQKVLENERKKLMLGFQHLSAKELEYIKLVRKVKVANKMYLSMISRQNGLLLAKEGASGNVSVIDYAEKPYTPLNQNSTFILLGGLFFGLVFGIFWVALARVLHRGVGDVKLLESKTNTPVLASVMFSKAGEKLCSKKRKPESADLIVFKDPSDIAVEGLRNLRTGVHFALESIKEDKKNNIIVVSGPTPSVGKSFVSANFAAVYASSGNKVLLIDGDMRRGRLHGCLGRLDSGPGLSELTLGKASYEEAVQKITDNLFFISKGGNVSHTSEALISKNFGDLLEQCQTDYDVVIIDTPPVLLVTDASIIAQHASQVLVVVKAGITKVEEVEHTISHLSKVGVDTSGLIMNFVGKGAGYYGYGGSYGYKYKY